MAIATPLAGRLAGTRLAGKLVMIVYGSALSPYVRKVLVFAAEKGLEVENRATPPQSEDSDFRAASPFGKIPAFRDGDFVISDSSAIVSYLEAVHPEPALIPAEPEARAQCVWFDEFADTIFFATGVKIFFNRVVAQHLLKQGADLALADAAEADELPAILDYFERVSPQHGYLIGDAVSLADIAVASPWVNLAHAGVAIDADLHPRTAAYVGRILARPSFAAVIGRDCAFLARFGVRSLLA